MELARVETKYHYNLPDELDINQKDVQIIFVNGKFEKCHINFSDHWNRDCWKAFVEIEKKITILEKAQ